MNIPVDPVKGVQAIRGVLQSFMGLASKVDWVTHRIAETAEGVVLTERTDRFRLEAHPLDHPSGGCATMTR